MNEETIKTIGIIITTTILVAGGMYTITSEDKQALEKQIAVLEANKTFSMENVVDKSGTPAKLTEVETDLVTSGFPVEVVDVVAEVIG